ncbi:hypothetical protein D6821_02615 [Candidatus Parcubacteria bacterium]|nr:MAG: hypothetical protein D6821_02615 [Candidatus Parcubacteria bacterium]
MAMFDIIPLILISVSLAVIIIIVVRKFSALAALDVNTIKEEREAHLKKKIIKERLKRNIVQWGKQLQKTAQPLAREASRIYQRFYQQLEKRREHYRMAASSVPVSQTKKLEQLFAEVESCIKQNKYEEAEKKLIEIVGLEPRNPRAFKLLGKVYFELKSFEEARQSLEHFLRLVESQLKVSDNISPEGERNDWDNLVAGAYYDLALINQELGYLEEANNALKKALEFEPNNPRYLDTMLEISIMKKDKLNAQDVLKRLQAANPENQKLAEFIERIEKL